MTLTRSQDERLHSSSTASKRANHLWSEVINRCIISNNEISSSKHDIDNIIGSETSSDDSNYEEDENYQSEDSKQLSSNFVSNIPSHHRTISTFQKINSHNEKKNHLNSEDFIPLPSIKKRSF